MALCLKPKSKTLNPLLPSLRLSSSSPSSSPPPHTTTPNIETETTTATTDANRSNNKSKDYSSYFSDIKARLKQQQQQQSPPAPPRRYPAATTPPPIGSAKPTKIPSLDEIRRNLAEFRLRATSSTPSSSSSSSSPTISFQDLYKSNVIDKPVGGVGGEGKPDRLSIDAIRESLRQLRSSQPPSGSQTGFGGRFRNPNQGTSHPLNLQSLKDKLNLRPGGSSTPSAPLIRGSDSLPDAIFGRELWEKKKAEEAGKDGGKDPKERKTDFLKMYSFDDLGEKLRRLRPEEAGKGKGKKEWFSLKELNERLAKLRELEEKETESRIGGVSFKDLRESLVKLRDSDTNKKFSMHRLSIIAHLGGQVTPTFMLKHPKEHLVEQYFLPDHMSSAEKLKLELKKVRDEFKMSESDCGSARVQVAQLTTKIKHLETLLHKKDKHSIKGMKAMVKKRAKLLKYLRRTDWESYCLIHSKFVIRDPSDEKRNKKEESGKKEKKFKKVKKTKRGKRKAMLV